MARGQCSPVLLPAAQTRRRAPMILRAEAMESGALQEQSAYRHDREAEVRRIGICGSSPPEEAPSRPMPIPLTVAQHPPPTVILRAGEDGCCRNAEPAYAP